MPFEIINQDITNMKTDAIVNAANTRLQQGGGVCGVIFKAAGAEQLQAACDQIGHCEVGEAVITPGYGLEADYVIHTVGPVWQGGHENEEELLTSAYQKSLLLAKKHDLNSIAFPLISAGIYGYPSEAAKKVGINTIQTFLASNDLTVYLVLFS